MTDDSLRIADDFPRPSLQDWNTTVEKSGAGYLLERMDRELPGGASLELLYEGDAKKNAAAFGATAGWRVCPEFSDPRMEICAQQIRADLEHGAQSIWLHLGVDRGTRVLTPGDVETVLEHVALDNIEVHLAPESEALPLVGAFLAVAEQRGHDPSELRGGLGIDPLGCFARTGTLPAGVSAALSDLGDLSEFVQAHAPGLRTALVDTEPYHDAGASPELELACAFATALAYLRTMESRGCDVADAASSITFAFSVSGHVFEQAAKLRAARSLWWKIQRAAQIEQPAPMFMYARTSRRSLTTRGAWNNILRGTGEALSAVIGTANRIAIAPFDAAVGPSDDFARRLAHNAQRILQTEGQLHRVADPGAGSWALETLTTNTARSGWEHFRRIERLGGMVRALTEGHIARDIERAVQRERTLIATRKLGIVGVSEFPQLDEEPIVREPVDLREVEGELGNPFGTSTHDDRLEALSALLTRYADPDESGIRRVEAQVAAARHSVDLVNLAAARRGGCPSAHILPMRQAPRAASWEALRAASDQFRQNHDALPQAFLVDLSTVEPSAKGLSSSTPGRNQRELEWAQRLLGSAGFYATLATDPRDLTASDEETNFGPGLVLLSGALELNDERLVDVCARLRAQGVRAIGSIGKPAEDEARLRRCGVTFFLHAGLPVLNVLETVQQRVKVRR